MKKTSSTSSADAFSDFFRNATKEEKIELFTKVAKKACEDQRKVFKKARMSFRTAS